MAAVAVNGLSKTSGNCENLMTGIDEQHELLPQSYLMLQSLTELDGDGLNPIAVGSSVRLQTLTELDGKIVSAHTQDKDKQILQQDVEIHCQQQLGADHPQVFVKPQDLPPKRQQGSSQITCNSAQR